MPGQRKLSKDTETFIYMI